MSTLSVVGEVLIERARQDHKWGEQNHPMIRPAISTMQPEEIAEWYGIPSEWTAKESCEMEFRVGNGSYFDVLIEEVCEALAGAAVSDEAARPELIQVTAVAIACIEAIDRRRASRDCPCPPGMKCRTPSCKRLSQGDQQHEPTK